MKFLILFAQANETFRVAELEALADLYNISVDLSGYDKNSPFLLVDLPDVATAKKLVQRSILVRSLFEYYGKADDLDTLHEGLKRDFAPEFWESYRECSFKFDVISYQGSREKAEQVKMIESFEYLGFEGPIRMKKYDQCFTILENYYETTHIGEIPRLNTIYFARFICDSSRKLVEKYDLKKRRYIGTTSFEAELSLVTCNVAKCSPGKLVYDPFVGTGSFLVCAGAFGSLTMGSDIDPRTMRGKSIKTNLATNFKQYGIESKLLDTMTMDFTHNALRPDLKIDAIISDPPYGVREGLKVLGSKFEEHAEQQRQVSIDGVPAYLAEGYIAPKKPYAFSKLMTDLLSFANERLTDDGRLAFWMPTANEDMQENKIPRHPGLELVSYGIQEFGKWSRALLVYRKRRENEPIALESSFEKGLKFDPAEEFREKYFRGFKPKDEDDA